MFPPPSFKLAIPGIVLSVFLLSSAGASAPSSSIHVGEKGSLTITNTSGASGIFRGRFVVVAADTDPQVAMRYVNVPSVRAHAPSWVSEGKSSALGHANAAEGGDGFDPAVQKGDSQSRTIDIFHAGRTTFLEATGATMQGNKVTWQFPAQADFNFSASLTLPPDGSAPLLEYSFTPKKPGWYSAGYAGAPAVALEKADEIWQPLIWQEKRFPPESLLTPAGYCTLPVSFVTTGGTTVGVAADPHEMPFMPLPNWSNSTFAVAVRNENGLAQPMIFAPMFGGPKSRMPAGAPFVFHARLILDSARSAQAYEDVARGLYGFHDYRENVVSLNTTLENMIDYGLSKYSRFDTDLKGCAYDTDVPGSVKNVSSLHPLEAAVITDDPAIFNDRALPILEFMLSREKFLFALDRTIKTQNPSRLLHGPCAPSSEFSAAYAFGGQLSPVLLATARDLAASANRSKKLDSWVQTLALYRTTGDPAMLAAARTGADAYLAQRIDKTQTLFNPNEAGSYFFWTSYSPLWINLTDLYEETKDPKYLAAAHQGAREFMEFVNMSPRIPPGNVTVNPGGKAPMYSYLARNGRKPMNAPEESVPAWRLSEIGLTAESSSTMISHRGIFMTSFAAWLMRLSSLTGDRFLHDAARSAVVGRYASFPGYHMNTERSTVYEKADYPLHTFQELSYNSFHYNHPWPHITLLFDYLVNDVFNKSAGGITFPGRFAEGYGYLQSRIYGDRPGSFYGEDGVRLWMPKGLLKIDSPQINYLAGRRGDTLYVALANQSPDALQATVNLNAERLSFPPGQPLKVRVWRDNHLSTAVVATDGRFTVPVSPAGITAVAIEGVKPLVRFQDQFGQGAPVANSPLVSVPVGDAQAMILSFGPGLTNAYIYLRETDDTVESATLHYRSGNQWKTETDSRYPFEFSVPVDPGSPGFEFTLETRMKDGTTQLSKSVTLPVKSNTAAL